MVVRVEGGENNQDGDKKDMEERNKEFWIDFEGGTCPNVLALFMDQMALPKQLLSSPHTNCRPLRLNRIWSGPEKEEGDEKVGIINSLLGETEKDLSITQVEYTLWTYTVVESKRKPVGDASLGLKGEVAAPEAVLAHQKLNAALTECKETHYIRHTTLEQMEALVDLLSDEVRGQN